MSSQAEQDTFIEGLREDGILDELNASLGRAEVEAPAEAETVEGPEEVEAPAEETVDEEPDQTPSEVEPEEDEEREVPQEPVAEGEVDYIELAPETEEYLAKYGGDLNEALKAAANAQSLIGRQGNELGEVRRELQEMRDALVEYQSSQYQPYRTQVPDPDEADEEELVQAYASIAYEAIERQDASTLQQAVEAWGEIQPFQATQFVSRLQQQAYTNQLAALQAQEGQGEMQQRMEELTTKYPDLSARAEDIGAEAQKSPALGRLLQEDVPPAERVNALEELYLRVANRTTSETSQQALRRVAVKQSEEARRARQQAQVATSGRGSVAEPETTARKIPLGNTGRSVDLNRVDEILKSDRI